VAWQAAMLLAEAAGIFPRVHLTIAKDIPVAGGMAGGSADAAATLLACARLWDLDAGAPELAALAARLGADVTFPLLGGTAVGTGRGEVLEPVPCPARLHWVFAFAGFGISAGAAYRELDRLRADGAAPAPTVLTGPPDRLVAALADGDLQRIAANLGNDLQPAALSLVPPLTDTLAAGAAVDGVLAALVSGSGPTCAFLCADAETATLVAATLESEAVCRAARTATGPVPGATLF
jgi:4-diphosphocytidyl-2-C-methyl-D-erythritol kinase